MKDKQFPEVPVLNNILKKEFFIKEIVKNYLLCLILKMS